MSNHLTVNTSKTKLIYVSERIQRNLPVIYYNQESLDWAEDFEYLKCMLSKMENLLMIKRQL